LIQPGSEARLRQLWPTHAEQSKRTQKTVFCAVIIATLKRE